MTGTLFTQLNTCLNFWGLPRKRVWNIRGLLRKLVGNFGCRNYFKSDLLRRWYMYTYTYRCGSLHSSHRDPGSPPSQQPAQLWAARTAPPSSPVHTPTVSVFIDMYICLWTYLYICMCVHVYTYACGIISIVYPPTAPLCTYIYDLHTYVCMHGHMYECAYVYICIRHYLYSLSLKSTCMHIYICIRMHMYVCMYIYIHVYICMYYTAMASFPVHTQTAPVI